MAVSAARLCSSAERNSRLPAFRSSMHLTRAADKLSAYLKCVEERKAGNNEFLSAEAQTRAALEASPLPEVRYFLEHFVPAFELTLDELGTIDTEGRHGADKA